MKVALTSTVALFVIASFPLLAQEQPNEVAAAKPDGKPTSCLTYTKNDGMIYCVLCTSGLNWTESVKEQGTPIVISDVVGKAGVGATKEEAKANLTDVRTRKSSLGKTLVYIDQKRPFKDVKVLYLDLDFNRGVELTYETLKEVKFTAEK
jgi:hypothetical protein